MNSPNVNKEFKVYFRIILHKALNFLILYTRLIFKKHLPNKFTQKRRG